MEKVRQTAEGASIQVREAGSILIFVGSGQPEYECQVYEVPDELPGFVAENTEAPNNFAYTSNELRNVFVFVY